MSIPDRLFRISKTYLHQVRDRIDAELTEREAAVRELEKTPGSGASTNDATDADSLMRRAEERVAAARRDLETRKQTASASTSAEPTLAPGEKTVAQAAAEAHDPDALDYRILGVAVGADFTAVQAAYQKLSARCDPRRFPEGSGEQQDAARILERVNVAYENLRKRLDPTVKRFDKLEFE